MPFKRTIAILFIFIVSGSGALAATDFPYAEFNLTVPAYESPYPGLGSNYSSLGKGIETVMWNPAGLAKIGTAESVFSINSSTGFTSFPKNYNISDTSMEVGQKSTGFSNAILFTADPTATIITTREFTGHINYNSNSSSLGYKQSIKIGENFAFGISTRGNTGLSANLGGSAPAQLVTDIDLTNVSNFMGSGISTSNGRLTYSYTPQGQAPYTFTSEASAWSGFLKQDQRVPFTAVSDSHDDINIESSYTMTGAGKWGGLSIGANITPISATANIDNSVKLIAKEGTGDIYFYVPNFDPNNQAEVLQWMIDPNQYGSQAGYTKRYFRVPAGETVAEAKYRGFFNASTVRADLGAMYDLGDILTLGLALENVNAASLDFKGTGQVAYANTRISTTGATGLIDPAGTSFNFFSDTFFPISGTENMGMLPEIQTALPQRLKVGATLRKPFLITLDYEQQTNPLSFKIQKSDGTYSNLTVSDLKFVRGGIESQLLILPIWMRFGLTVMLKPTVAGYEDSSNNGLDKAFKYGVLPVKLDLGSFINLWGTEVGGALGFNAMPVFSIVQLDSLNQDFSKVLFYNLFVRRDIWQLSYMSVLDPGATGSAYSTAQKTDGMVKDPISVIKMINTLSLSMRF